MFNLHKLSTKPDMSSADIDENWQLIVDAIRGLQSTADFGAVTITEAHTDENGLTFTLSNGEVLGPLPFSGTPMRILGAWTVGATYRIGDIIGTTEGTLIVTLDHTATVLETDMAAGRLAYIAKHGKDAKSVDFRSFQALGTVTGGSRLVGFYVTVRKCVLTPIVPVACVLATPISSGGTGFDVVLKKITAAGVTTDLGNFTISPGASAQTLPITADFDVNDVLAVYQVGGAGSTGGANLSITAALYGSAADAVEETPSEGGGGEDPGTGTGGSATVYQTINGLGDVVAYNRHLGSVLIAEDCELAADRPIKAEILTWWDGAAATVEVEVRKQTVSGTIELLGTLTFTNSTRTPSLAIDEALLAGEKLRFYQQPIGGTLPPCGDIVIAYALVPSAA